MKIGNLIKHKRSSRTAIILDIFLSKGHKLEHRNTEHAKVLFSGDSTTTQAPFHLLKDNWEIIK